MEGVRPASRDDVPRLVELAKGAIDELSATKGGEVWARREARRAPIDASLASALDNPNYYVLVGTIDSVPVGYAVVRWDRYRESARLGVIEDLYVEPDAREVGVGEALMNEIVAWCTAQGCEGIDALALPGMRETKNFFEAFGLTARAIIVHRALPGQST